VARRDKVLSEVPAGSSGLRLIREEKESLKDKEKYKESYRVVDEASDKLLAECDLYGNAAFVNIEIRDENGTQWVMKPSRKIMPNRWSFYSVTGECLFEIKRPNVIHFMNPLRRTYFYIINKQTNQKFKFKDLDSNLGDLLFNTSTFVWSITDNKDELATIQRLAKKGEERPEKGFFNKLKRLFRSSNWVLITQSDKPVVEAPIFLGLILLLEEHTKNPAA
jgi:hypothetical protein